MRPGLALPGPGDDGVLTWAGLPHVGEVTGVTQADEARPPARYMLRTGPEAWQIRLRHPAGSLDAAVAQGRRRNQWLGFGILAVLVAGVALVTVNARRAERLAAQQLDFVAAVSHELRTPLAIVRTAAQNVSSGAVDEPARTRGYGELIEREGRRLTEMVEQVLGYAGIDALGRGVQVGPADLASLVRGAVESYTSLLAEQGITPRLALASDLPMVQADEAAVHRAVQNMLSNVVKYAAEGGWVFVRADRSVWHGRPGSWPGSSSRSIGAGPPRNDRSRGAGSASASSGASPKPTAGT